MSFANTFVEGKDYKKVSGLPEATKPVVREFFSYNCPHCYQAEPTVEKMARLLKGKVTFKRTPVGAGRPSWILSQEAYYVAQKLKITNQVHSKIFHYIHEEAGPFTNAQQLKAFFEFQAVSGKEFDKVYNSKDKKTTLDNYGIQLELSGITGVPTLLVNGVYVVNPGEHTAQELAKLVQFLVAKK
ncbi:thiol:disulfide interchange protein DsbA/DsbL [Shewanella sp. 202IG2-18]|uniref:thiol:disulfide interchange protein DsbA/DsbL n=1 Tax=Parashewanella hymeniacidonis TaxID=2807618 RepID=UPI001961B945|nr:thiol:disulfide interchange protein DsbA/DsbL [Parashewanella hymeniacidonis]